MLKLGSHAQTVTFSLAETCVIGANVAANVANAMTTTDKTLNNFFMIIPFLIVKRFLLHYNTSFLS